MNTNSFLSSLRKSRAFSLVETVIAMGVVSFAMLGILGLIPVGLSNFRDAINFTAESQIIQGLSNDILLSNYDELVAEYPAGVKKERFYDDQAAELPTAQSAGRVFTVTVGLNDLMAPDFDSSAGKTALIEIVNIKSQGAVKKYSIVVPKG